MKTEKSKYWKFIDGGELEKHYSNQVDFSMLDFKSFLMTKQQEVIDEVIRVYKVDLGDLYKKSRERKYVEPRQMVMFLFRETLQLSYCKISKLFRCHHATVIHSVKTTKSLIATNYDIWTKYCKLNIEKPYIEPTNPIIKDEIGKGKTD